MNIQIGDVFDIPDPSRSSMRKGEVWKINNDCTYDVLLLPERNVPFELIYVPMSVKIEVEPRDIVLYRKNGGVYEVYVSKVDWNSQSLQIRLIQRNLKYRDNKLFL
jgi:hypothetical protein